MIYSKFNSPRRTPVEVQANTPTRNALGQPVPSWTTVARIYGYSRPATGRELAVAGQTNALLSHVIETRWPGSSLTITPANRLLVNGRTFNVTWTDNVEEQNQVLLIGCVERVGGDAG